MYYFDHVFLFQLLLKLNLAQHIGRVDIYEYAKHGRIWVIKHKAEVGKLPYVVKDFYSKCLL